MINEIKEILDFIKDYLDIFSDSQLDLRFEYNDSKLLLDYITNLQEDIRTGQEINSELQQENARLKENNSNMQEEMARVWEENEGLKDIVVEKDNQIKGMILQKTDYTAVNILEMKLEDYKSRCEKAIEYVKVKARNNCWIDQYEASDLINILQNGSDDNE